MVDVLSLPLIFYLKYDIIYMMDSIYSQFDSNIFKYIKESLEVEGFFNKLYYRNIVKVTKDFYNVFEKKTIEYAVWSDFFDALQMYLIGYGFSFSKIKKYFSIIKNNIELIKRTSIGF